MAWIKLASYLPVLISSLWASGCAIGGNSANSFPEVRPEGLLKIVGESAQTNGFNCTASSMGDSMAFIGELKRIYPAGWRAASRVTFAPKYRVTLGSTEVLVLERGVVMITDVDGKRKVLFQQGNVDEIEKMVKKCVREHKSDVDFTSMRFRTNHGPATESKSREHWS
ncbi:hypothetical protein [Stenotrophomonas rhizophila]|uniref:hypothetical protein n=1 Tax=Stenotrophomonas rhizophila TaxID=216778 RepID=UPI001E64172B|nr:hypothetical protein [Stenotrophomonas rhizophila]MCC7633318.1 hypothetical protein [Stenotrophomonas rhizophila]MCC7662209.1 hypothetical protein [Stenotrophomonas rhizophila]